MALIESSILGIPTFSYQIGIEENSDMLYIPFSEYGISIIREDSELREIINNLTDISSYKNMPNTLHINAVVNTLSHLIK